MEESYKTKSVLVSDTGLFSCAAEKLSESFGKVYYTSPWVADYPSSYRTELGEGFPEYERVDDIFDVIDDVDLFFFPELHQGPLQLYLQEHGKRVWGSRMGDELEVYREDAKEHFKELGIPQTPYEVVKGMTALRKYIKSHDKDKLWIKISLTRGDTETFSVEGYERSKNLLDQMEADFGPVSENRTFIVEGNIPGTLDLAIDTYCIDGEFPSKSILGTEVKDQGYIGVVKNWRDFPKFLRDNYKTLAPDLENYQYRNFFAVEHRVGKDMAVFSDPCCRTGSPIFELELNMIKNLPDILWNGADGKLVEPEYDGKYGFEVVLKSEWVDDHPLKIDFPEKYKGNIKLRYATRFPDGLWIMPQNSGAEFGDIVAHGDSLDDCFEQVEEIASQIKGIKVEACIGSLSGLKENISNLKSWGINMEGI